MDEGLPLVGVIGAGTTIALVDGAALGGGCELARRTSISG